MRSWFAITLPGLLAAVCLAAFIAAGCSSSRFTIFETNREADFTAWVETLRVSLNAEGNAGNASAAAAKIGEWQRANMKWKGGVRFIFPDYLSAWNTETNCAGFSAVAIEALGRLGFDDFRMLEVDYPAPPDEPGNNWHVVTTDLTSFLTNGSLYTMLPNSTWRDAASLVHADWTRYRLRDRSARILEEVTR